MKKSMVNELVQGLGESRTPRLFDTEMAMIASLYRKFNFPMNNIPTKLSLSRGEERIEFMQEELDEFKEAFMAEDIAKMADALIDLVYVVKGTAIEMGLPWAHLFDDVHRANMSKVPGPTHRGHKIDLMKPEGWVGPQTEAILMQYGPK